MPSLERDVLEFIVFACLFEYDDCELTTKDDKEQHCVFYINHMRADHARPGFDFRVFGQSWSLQSSDEVR